MNERMLSSFWPNPDASLGNLIQNMEEGINLVSLIPEELMVFPRLDEQRDNTMNFFNLENTINFEEVHRRQEEALELKKEPEQSFDSISEKKEEGQRFSQLLDLAEGKTTKKGLRYLAKLVYQTLKTRDLTNQTEIVAQIESYMLRNTEKSFVKIQEVKKQARNIRRRLYDALNVLIAAGILDKTENSIQLKANRIHIANRYSLNGIRNRLGRELTSRERRLKAKYDTVHDMRKKLECIKKLASRNYQADQASMIKIPFPILMVNSVATSDITVEYTHGAQIIKVQTKGPLDLCADMDIVMILNETLVKMEEPQREKLQKLQTEDHYF